MLEELPSLSTVGLIEFAATILATLWLERFGSNFISGCTFFFGSQFNEGDEVYIEGQRAVIVKQGLQTTIFQVDDRKRGLVWRYVKNTQISWLKLEKVVRSPELDNLKQQNFNKNCNNRKQKEEVE